MPPSTLSRTLPALLAALSACASPAPPWQDPALPVAARVADLVGRLTLEALPHEPIVLATFADTENNQVMLTQWVGYNA